MTHELLPPGGGDISGKPLITLEQAHARHTLNDFLFEFYPGKWNQGRELKRPVTDEDLARAFEMAGLEEVDQMMRLGSITNVGEVRQLYKKPTNDQRIYVWVRDKGKCYYCTDNAHPDFGGLNPDHYQAFSQGGDTTLGNLFCACRRCNMAKNQNSGEGFKRLLDSPAGRYYRDALFNYYTGKETKDRDIQIANDIMYG